MAFPNPFKKRKYNNVFVEPDEIFLDATNLPKFDKQQFEGRMEKPIPKRSIMFVGGFFIFIFIAFTARLVYMQGVQGNSFFNLSQQNQLSRDPIFAERGVVYDRNAVELAWNDVPSNGEPFSRRAYIAQAGFGHLLGYVGYPSTDSSGNYWQTEFIGKDGVEKEYNDKLKGVNGTRLTERDVHGAVTVSNQIYKPTPGENLTLSIDARLQEHFAEAIKKVMNESGYKGGAGLIMDIHTGEMLAVTSIPEYSSGVMSEGNDRKAINSYLTDPAHPFLDRAIAGLYSPGSIVKPYMAMAGLTEGVITPNTLIAAHGTISVPNPYDPAHPTIFRDYRADNGVIDVRHALAYSSNIFFYNVGGGYQSQPGIGIDNIGKYLTMFGIAQPTGIDLPNEKQGIIPSPAWKAKVFNGDPWRIGDTYNTAIGQYGVQVTPVQMIRAVASIANSGTLVSPHIIKGDMSYESKKVKLTLSQEWFQVVREGMRLVVSDNLGTAKALNALPFKVAAKTGTAQIGVHNENLNAWATGFFPYDNPKYAFVVMMEKGTEVTAPGAAAVALDELTWMSQNTPEYTN
jgi:penicillin-binding protein 2